MTFNQAAQEHNNGQQLKGHPGIEDRKSVRTRGGRWLQEEKKNVFWDQKGNFTMLSQYLWPHL